MNVRGIGEKSFLKLKPLVYGGADQAQRPMTRPARRSGAPYRQRPDGESGASLAELVIVLVIASLLVAFTVPTTARRSMRDEPARPRA